MYLFLMNMYITHKLGMVSETIKWKKSCTEDGTYKNVIFILLF